jgi:hypothetical protein
MHGSNYMFKYMGMKWYLLELCLYALGTVVFAVSTLIDWCLERRVD